MHVSKGLVSIIVPVYNAERRLPTCLDSLVGQTYADLQILLIDDGSSDSSPDICDDYATRDSRVKVMHVPNGGIAAAQNVGLDAVRGDYIAFSDDDDILAACNVESLLDALADTESDMSKGRWRQFGVSQTNGIAALAATQQPAGPESWTLIRDPLTAYQSVFCKSLRLLGGPQAEARYFNEANWCRLYRAGLWEGIRFPTGMYAQDVMVAGQLYLRMRHVVDVNQVLYYWLQSGTSVTHRERSASFYHDNVAAGTANFRLCLESGVTPARSYYTVTGSLRLEEAAVCRAEGRGESILHQDQEEVRQLLRQISPRQRAECSLKSRLRLAEKVIYDRKIHRMK